MQGFKSQGSQKPTAMGSLLQASTYGATIPKIYGQTQSPLLAIWAANLRQGGGIKKFKQFKKGITNYVENIDFLLGHAPIMGVLQVMVNGGNYPLNFTSQSLTAAAGSGSYEVTDSNFYFVTAVTLTVDYTFDVDDYGGQGPQTLTGSYEIPLWNELETGPDPTGPTTYRCWPFCYRWQPGYGPTIQIDADTFPGGTLKIYYAQLMDATSFQPPLTKLSLTFEPQLGSGDEYSEAPAPFNAQQIIYPHFAGCGGAAVDLGASGALPQLQPEVRGKWGIYPSGDCDFADMIEDIFKSGLAQAAIEIDTDTAYTQMESGLSSYDLPGTVQKKVNASSTTSLPPILYDMPNTAGNVLVAVVKSAGTLGISSSAGDGWAPIFGSDAGWQMWYAIAAGGPNTVTISGATGAWQASILEIDMGSPAPAFPSAPIAGDNILILLPTEVATFSDGIAGVVAGVGPPPQAGFSVAGNNPFGGSGATTTWSGFGTGSIPTDAHIVSATLYALLVADTDDPDVDFVGPFSITGEGWNAVTATTDKSFADFATFMASYQPVIGVAASVEKSYAWSGAIKNVYLEVVYTLPSGSAPVAPGNPIDQVVVTAEAGASITSTVQQGFPGFLLAVPFYASDDGPSGMDIVNWDDLTPANFYENSPAAFQMQGRVVRSPGTYSFQTQGTAPSALGVLSLKSTVPSNYPMPLGNFLDLPSLDLVRAQCRANGLWGSLSMNSQSAASDWLKTVYQAANAAPVFLGSKLYSFPYSEASIAGNGCKYTAPTAAGPIANLDANNGDFVGNGGCPKLTTGSRVGLPNVLQMQCIDRNSNYNQAVVQQPDAASIALYGERKADPIVNNAVQDPAIARSLLGIQVRRNQYAGDGYEFTASARWILLAPMDLITLADEQQGLIALPVRITSYDEQDDGSFTGTAEPFVYGVNAPTPLSVTSSTQNPTGITETAGDVNPPIIFEPVPRLCAEQNQAQLWVVVSSSADNYGGCQVYVSTNGGSSYNPAGDPLLGSAITGETTADWPAASTPDTTNDLALDLTESNGTLQSYDVSDEDNFLYPCYVAGGGVVVEMGGTEIAAPGVLQMGGAAIADLGGVAMGGVDIAEPDFGYELMTYGTAVLTATNKYTLKATGSGNHLDRGVFGAPAAGTGIDHPLGSRFAFLSPAGTGILKLNMDSQWIGVELFFKIVSFNEFGSGTQSLSDVPAYSYTPNGVPYS
jgi:Putative phage tail protein